MGHVGTEQAMRAVEHLQLDALIVVTRGHDLMLHSGLIGHQPALRGTPAYRDRKFCDAPTAPPVPSKNPTLAR